MTNREWLNNLSDEDFACEVLASCNMCVNAGKNCKEHNEMNCFEGQKKWLEQEHELERENDA